ncbi:MAG: YtxH domain-containing protein [Gemmatimonadales bacterium]|nr:YtxH domain-containing protein [Gemmatimonadales bacterium]
MSEREGGDGRLGWLLAGAAIGALLAVLYAPESGRATRQRLGRRLSGLRESGPARLLALVDDLLGDDADEAADAAPATARPVSAKAELRGRLAEERARRRARLPRPKVPGRPGA